MDATPEKRVLPASGDTDNQHRWPTHAAGRLQASPGASLPDGVAVRGACPRRRRAPCLGGSCRRVEMPPYKVVLGVRLLILCARRGFCSVFGSIIALQEQGARRLRGQAPRTATSPRHARAGSPSGVPGAGLQREWAIGAGCPCLLRPAERVFQRGLLRPPIQNCM